MPLKVTDPKDELGDGSGAGVDLDAEELMRVNGVAGSFENRLRLAETAKHVANFPLQPLHVLHRHVEEVRGAARRVEDGRVAELVQEIADLLSGLGELPAFRQRDGRGLDVGPLLAEGLDDRRQHQPLDIGPGREVAPSLCRSFLSRARSSSVPKIAGSTSRHCFRPASISRPICSSVKGSAVACSKRPPLKRSTDCMRIGEKPPVFIVVQREPAMSGNAVIRPSSRSLLSIAVKQSLGSNPTSSAKNVNRQRIRKWATRSGA